MKQIIYDIKSQPVIATVSLVGTALAIFLIMVVVMLQQVKTAGYSPESERDRMLHWRSTSLAMDESEEDTSNGPLSYEVIKEHLLPLTTAEAVTVYCSWTTPHSAALPGELTVSADVKETDHTFFDVFDFRFISGAPYTEAEFQSGLPRAVITESVARKVFKSTDVVGREFLLDTAPYVVSGVVKDVSSLADHAYGQIFIPFTSTGLENEMWEDGNMGMLSATILAPSSSDFPAIREEIARRGEAINTSLRANSGKHFIWRNRPYTTEKDAVEHWANLEPDLDGARRTRLITFLILLIVPAINLSSMTQSRLRRRTAEIAVRRAFGASASRIMGSIVMENFVTTCLAGIIGLVLCLAFAWIYGGSLFAEMDTAATPDVSVSMLFRWSTFFWALLFCFILNLLCSGYPAWRASRQSIVNSLAGASR